MCSIICHHSERKEGKKKRVSCIVFSSREQRKVVEFSKFSGWNPMSLKLIVRICMAIPSCTGGCLWSAEIQKALLRNAKKTSNSICWGVWASWFRIQVDLVNHSLLSCIILLGCFDRLVLSQLSRPTRIVNSQMREMINVGSGLLNLPDLNSFGTMITSDCPFRDDIESQVDAIVITVSVGHFLHLSLVYEIIWGCFFLTIYHVARVISFCWGHPQKAYIEIALSMLPSQQPRTTCFFPIIWLLRVRQGVRVSQLFGGLPVWILFEAGPHGSNMVQWSFVQLTITDL